jgi:hypothetical protein
MSPAALFDPAILWNSSAALSMNCWSNLRCGHVLLTICLTSFSRIC